MLGSQLRRLGWYLIPLAIAAWGIFTVFAVIDLTTIPAPLRWLALAIGAAATLALAGWIWARQR